MKKRWLRSLLAAGTTFVAFALASSLGWAEEGPTPSDTSAKSSAAPVVPKPRPRPRAARTVRTQTGLMRLPQPVTVGRTTYYWYRLVPGPAQSQSSYVVSPPPQPAGAGWQCCLILGIGY